MNSLTPNVPQQIIHKLIGSDHYFPNNTRYPLLIYKQVFEFKTEAAKAVQELLKQNHWINSWVNSIYDFHHYHSNTHEVLVIIAGSGEVQIGGPNGEIFAISQGDVIIFPAGVAHKSIDLSDGFKCVGAYPFDLDYDMHYGKADEHPKVDENIDKVGLPSSDPIFGRKGLMFDYW